MKIHSIKLVNLRQYKNVTLDFSCDENKKITVVIGDNNAGKTTIVNAFIWGLYRINNFPDGIVINRNAADGLSVDESVDAKVEIELDHKNVDYTITTREEYYKAADGKIYVKTKAYTRIVKNDGDNPSIVPTDRVVSEINAILSSDLKEYFFFDGENNSIDSVTSKKNLTDSVSDLMGLKRTEEMKNYYDPTKKLSVPNKLRAKLVTTNEDKRVVYEDSLEKAQKERDEAEEDLISEENEISALETQLAEKEKILDANKDVEQDQQEKKRLTKEIGEAKTLINDNFTSIISIVNTNNALLKLMFAKSFVNNSLEQNIESSSFNGSQSLSHISEEVIDQLISRGYCLCGTKIENKTAVYEHLLSEKEHMEPRDFGKYASDFVSAESSNRMYSNSTVENISKQINDEIDVIRSLDEKETALQDIEKRISGRTDVGNLQIDINNIKAQINTHQGIKNNISNSTIPRCLENITYYQDELDNLTSKSAGNEFVLKCIEYAEYLYRKTESTLSSKKQQIKTNLQSIVNDIFINMYHGNRVIEIDDSFRAVAKLPGTSSLDENPGLTTVKNFSFVTGLMKLIKENVIARSDDDYTTVYPLVLDAPFSKADEKHIQNICAALPLYCDQIIICVMEKDYNSAKDVIDSNIGKLYRIVKDTEILSHIEEVE